MFSGRKGWSRQRRKRRPRLNGFTRLFNGMNFFSYLVIFEKYLSFSERTICIEKTFNGMFSEAEKKNYERYCCFRVFEVNTAFKVHQEKKENEYVNFQSKLINIMK